ncbi:MAG: hypothetical protein ACRCWJ_04465, partial [Casimicrobium sp.]
GPNRFAHTDFVDDSESNTGAGITTSAATTSLASNAAMGSDVVDVVGMRAGSTGGVDSVAQPASKKVIPIAVYLMRSVFIFAINHTECLQGLSRAARQGAIPSHRNGSQQMLIQKCVSRLSNKVQ